MTQAGDAQPGLGAGELLKRSIRETLENKWGLIAVAAVPVLSYLVMQASAYFPFDVLPKDVLWPKILVGVVTVVVLVAWVLAIVSPAIFTVGWLRVLLLGHDAISRPIHLRLWKREFLTILYGILVGFLSLLPMMPIVVVFVWVMAGKEAFSVYPTLLALIPVGYFVLALVGARLSFAFASIAIDAPRGLRLSWRQTRGVGLSIFLVWILALLIGLALMSIGFLPQWDAVVEILTQQKHGVVTLTLLHATIMAFVGYFLYAVMLAAVAVAYREKGGLPEAQATT